MPFRQRIQRIDRSWRVDILKSLEIPPGRTGAVRAQDELRPLAKVLKVRILLDDRDLGLARVYSKVSVYIPMVASGSPVFADDHPDTADFQQGGLAKIECAKVDRAGQ